MGRPSVNRVEAGFELVAALRHVERHWPQYRDPDFWRELNPHLTVSDRPLQTVTPALMASPDVADRAGRQLDESGFLATPPVVADVRLAPLRRAINTLHARGLPTGFACVYDEYYQCFADLEPIFTPLLGRDYRWVAHGFWAFRIPPGGDAVSWLTGPSGPHRDSLGPDAAVLRGERPTILTLWLALTDVTTADSCVYVVPKYADRAYATDEREVTAEHFRLQDVRAVPVRAGGVLAWSTHLAHWGGRSTPDATAPRLSITMYFQRRDVPPFDASIFDRDGVVTLDDRLRWVLGSMGAHDLVARLPW